LTTGHLKAEKFLPNIRSDWIDHHKDWRRVLKEFLILDEFSLDDQLIKAIRPGM
jgi:hypothetical protein